MPSNVLQAIRYKNGSLEVLDQLLLPHKTVYVPILCVQDGWSVINKMQVRGAPAIAIVGVLSLAVEIASLEFSSNQEIEQFLLEKLDFLITSRPTAVNLSKAAIFLKNKIRHMCDSHSGAEKIKSFFIAEAETLLTKDVSDNTSIGQFGAKHLLNNTQDCHSISILTHCNTGSLATAGYGTALGVVRSLYSLKRLKHVYFTETRPYMQGSRLTSFELLHENIPSTLVCDSAVAALMAAGKVNAVVVGADRVVSNGDTANKIGTYQIAVTAAYHKILFYVAAPVTSIDFSLASGDQIAVEERPASEMLQLAGKQVSAVGTTVWNPAFDITPSSLISGGVITEHGVFSATELSKLALV